jgi:putative membrane protein
MTLAEALPTVNAVMNATSACALFAGYICIKQKRQDLHWKFMAAAFTASGLFLIGYLTRFALTGVHRYQGPFKGFYLALLGTHTLLAVVALPLILRTMWLSAVRKKYGAHRRIAVWTFPVWAYVSVTGVLVYLMLYRLPGWLATNPA